MSNDGQRPPEPDWARWEAEHGPVGFDATPPQQPERPAARSSAPLDIETSRHLWWGVTALGLISLILTLMMVNSDRTPFAQQLVDDVARQDPSLPLTLESAESYLTGALVLMAVIGIAFAGLFLYWVNKMRLGRLWARTVLTVIGTVTVVLAVPQLFAFGVDGGAMQILMSVAGILQGVLAGGAVYLMHRKDSQAYFLAARKR
ncbi:MULTISPECIES: hypothetical protein [Nocardiaceae]|uniref:hypothetical protein n=1 Tax=Nocardiaceae TaxID=85025 RepID=UPI00056D3B99|nr:MULTISPECIES: hypothetical protein [Rhodococcus]OZE99561.1 hypothetical protein CH301_15585 [Rhodococcus sp. 15-1189-1-1a]OZF13851.1 hypothetical protein CH299_15365 [Rhodococcus sp. 14-2686-1-2]OZF50987.1 hypothetical protein CH293_15895 [Rhodococcus sp. 14-2470-1b]